MGCSIFCCCSEECQIFHWDKDNHRADCKQLNILNKYHRPYAKEIRDSAVRGDIEIPALEKLLYKLGLTRPPIEYTRNYVIITPIKDNQSILGNTLLEETMG
jgi:hypothetical protein